MTLATTLTPEAHLVLLRSATDGFAAALATIPHEAPVPACPGWDLGDLGRHLESVHRWADTTARDGVRPAESVREDPSLTGTALVEGYRTTAGALVATLTGLAADAACWTFGPAPHRAGFWRRRQTFETLVHLGDAQESAGRPRDALAPEVAADGVDEVVRMFFPRQVRLRRIPPLTDVVRLVPDDVPGPGWTLRGDGTAAEGADPAADAEVHASADDLLRLAWRRLDAEEAVATGRAAVAGSVDAVIRTLGERLTP